MPIRTVIQRYFATRDVGLATISTWFDDGSYSDIEFVDDGTSANLDPWCTYPISMPDRFEHHDDFAAALQVLRDPYEPFLEAVRDDSASFAQTLCWGLRLGRAVSSHRLWDEICNLSQDDRQPTLDGDTFRFSTLNPWISTPEDRRALCRYRYDCRTGELTLVERFQHVERGE